MNNHDEKELTRQYQQLPRVDSPDHLDQSILQAADANVPEKRRFASNHWIPALATLCIAGAVFYIATPLFESASYHSPASDNSVSRSVSEEELTESEAVGSTASAVTASSVPVVQKPKLTKTESAIGVSEPRQAKKIIASKEKLDLQRSTKNEITEDKQRLGNVAATISQDDNLNTEIDSVRLLNAQRKRAGFRQQRIALSKKEIERRIQRITELADEALIEEAQQLLDQLIANCQDCEIPTTLAALKTSLKSAKGSDSAQK